MFSEIVDSVGLRCGRGTVADRAAIVDFVNSTVRECQTVDGALFSRDLVEDSIPCSSDPTIWSTPNSFRLMRTVRYPDGRYPDFLLPGRVLTDKEFYYYSAGTYFALHGCGTSGEIAIAYYRFLPRLQYYAETARPAVYDEVTDTWTYAAGIVTDDEKEVARARVSNWLLSTYAELIKEGATAKLTKMIKDETRSVQSYSLYKQLQDSMKRTEARETLGK